MATEVTVQLLYYDSYLEIMVEDNGKGFVTKQNDGIGLKNVRSRVDFLGGSLTLDSGKGGTTVVIKIPYKRKNAETTNHNR